jgi:hypothetical protein
MQNLHGFHVLNDQEACNRTAYWYSASIPSPES